MATTALDASLSSSLLMGQQVLLASPEIRRVSNVRHSSETAFLTMQHVSSTKLFAELKLTTDLHTLEAGMVVVFRHVPQF